MISRRLLGGLAMAGLARPAGATPGLSVFEMAEPSGEPGVALRVFVYRPAAWRPADQAIIVLHGQGRDADRYIAQWAPQAEATGLLVIAPEFSQRKYPGVAAYNWGNVVTEAGTPNPPEAWIFGAIDRIWAAAREKTGATQAGYALFGHSAGAQFVHRYLLLAEASQATTIITANAGSYTMPDRAIGFPFGLGNTAVTDAMLARALARPVTVLLGSEDIDPNHPALPRQPGAMAQGQHRLARGMLFFAKAREAATRLGVRFTWRLETVPGIAHDNSGMAARAATIARSTTA
jgi:poly(3-hydroxybutyrate) depolymerase